MKCKETQNRISAYLDGELEPQKSREIAEHLASCAACARVKAQLENAYDLLPENQPMPADPFMVTRVRAALTEATAGGRQRFLAVYRVLIPVSVAAGVLLGAVLGQNLSSHWPATTTVSTENLEANLLIEVPASSLTTTYLDLSSSEGSSYE
jgi:anti-sigma factor RsiW